MDPHEPLLHPSRWRGGPTLGSGGARTRIIASRKESPLSHPGAAHADDVRRIEILSAEWERIQITVRFRSIDDRPLDPASIRLHEADHAGLGGDHGRLVLPARASLGDDGAVVARFNVMQGPDQDPLPPGRWSVVALTGARREGRRRFQPLVAHDGAAAVAVLAGRVGTFLLSRGRYEVAPVLARDAHLSLAVTMGPPEPQMATGPAGAEGDDPDSLARSTLAGLVRPIRRLRPLAFRALWYRCRFSELRLRSTILRMSPFTTLGSSHQLAPYAAVRWPSMNSRMLFSKA